MKLIDFDFPNQRPFFLISGNCVVESEQSAIDTAGYLKEITNKLEIPFIYKSSFDKANRSSLDSFRGPGIEEGLKVLDKVKSTFNVPVISDIHEPEQAKMAAEVCDVIQIPAFLCRQTDLVVAAAKTKKIINLKKPQFSSASELSHAIKKCEVSGNPNIILCERGNSFGYNNLVVDMLNFQLLKELSKPVFFDVTHSLQQPGALEKSTGGRGQYVFELAKAGISQKIAGLFLETHPDPSIAKCDGPCALKLSDLEKFLSDLFELDALVKNF